MDDELHFPPGSPEALAAEQKEQAEAQAAAEAQNKSDADKTQEGDAAEAAAKAEADAKAKAEEDVQDAAQQEQNLNKPRTLLEAKQLEKQRRKEAEATVETERSAREAAEARVAELEGLLDKGKKAQTPADKAAIDDDLRAFAEEQGLDPEGLTKITDFLAKRLGGDKVPANVQKELDEIKAWRAQQEAGTARADEDRAIDSQAPAVKSQLKELGFELHVDKEAGAIMTEIKRLAHTPEFHDKPVEYIVWAKRAELSKMISPKKTSFETQTPSTAAANASDIDFSKGGLTPEQAAQAAMSDRPGSTMVFK